ncbi:response regulator transcription factor [Arthrobacter woluwensis]|uniref:response regulator transcription factor n=1 Tax=Arthrobacter woluwensis TaxID=156980 RepID=UPI0037FE7B07
MNPAPRPSVLLVEDDPVLGPLTAELLAPEYRVQLAVQGREGLHLALTQTWDVLVVDRGLPGLDGIAVVTALRERGMATPILLLTALGATEEKIRGLDAGANDYMTKPFDAGELAARLRALTRTYDAPPSSLSFGDWELDAAGRQVRSVHGLSASLTAKEGELIALLAAEPERVFSREEILSRVFQPTDTPGLVDTHVHHLRRKISRAAVRTVHGVGYQIGDPHD